MTTSPSQNLNHQNRVRTVQKGENLSEQPKCGCQVSPLRLMLLSPRQAISQLSTLFTDTGFQHCKEEELNSVSDAQKTAKRQGETHTREAA